MGLLFKSRSEKELCDIINRLEMNMSNNYKDNAQDNLKELEEKLEQICYSGKERKAVIDKYTKILSEYKVRMEGFSHKDQKPYWH